MKFLPPLIAFLLTVDFFAVVCALGAKLIAHEPITWAAIGWISLPWGLFGGGIILLIAANILGESIAENEDFD